MFKKKSEAWDYLAVELAVMLSETLHDTDDSDEWVYQYIPESRKVSEWLSGNPNATVSKIEQEIANTLLASLDFPYPPESFHREALLAAARAKQIVKYSH